MAAFRYMIPPIRVGATPTVREHLLPKAGVIGGHCRPPAHSGLPPKAGNEEVVPSLLVWGLRGHRSQPETHPDGCRGWRDRVQ